MPNKVKTKSQTIRVNGRLREILTVKDEEGRVIEKIIKPLMVEFYPRDIVQVIVGASILAIPVAFTEEVWNLGQSLPLINVLGFLLLSLLFIAVFSYYSYYRNRLMEHKGEFTKRIFSTYIFSLLVVAILLTLIQRAPWTTEFILAIKRAIIITFPASMSAAVADTIK